MQYHAWSPIFLYILHFGIVVLFTGGFDKRHTLIEDILENVGAKGRQQIIHVHYTAIFVTCTPYKKNEKPLFLPHGREFNKITFKDRTL